MVLITREAETTQSQESKVFGLEISKEKKEKL
jgi:hypothetical protein